MFARTFRLLLLATLCALPLGLRAQVEATLVALKSTFPADSEKVVVAIRLAHEPKWHTYWLQPGTGLPTEIAWQLPEGWSAGHIRWPAPKRVYDTAGNLAGNGYEAVTYLAIELTPPAVLPHGTPVTLRAKVDWLMCKDVCIPGSAELSLTLTPTDPDAITTANVTDSTEGSELLATLDMLPVPLPGDFTATALRSPDGKTIRLLVTGIGPQLSGPASEPWYFDADATIAYELQQPRVANTPEGDLALDLAVSPYADANATRLRGLLTFSEGPAYEMDIPIEAAPANSDIGNSSLGIGHSDEGASTTSLPALLLLAFVGGLILNLMPCVFPVLGLKIMGFVQQAGHDRRKVTMHGLAFTVGVLLTFWVLGGLLVTFWQGTGWGTQLQNPAVNFAVASVFLLFALSMSGVFEIGQSATRLGGATANKRGYFFSLLEGAFITIVATPCSAPLLGAAVGAALTSLPAPQAMLVFTFIALGLAAPYLILSLFPQGVKLLPRPGAWMETLKQFLAFPIYAAVGFFLWVLVPQVPEGKHLSLIFALVLIALGAWLYGRYATFGAKPARFRFGVFGGAALLVLGAWLGWPRPAAPTDIVWEPWSAERVAALREEGRPVYVDFTARWCFTCQTNKAAVFSGPGSGEVLKKFRDLDVATLRADWTNRDPLITAELARWNRAAVPFNLLYLPDSPDPVVLPELLTPGTVLDALAP
jgi:thiol:disulfide interchange protein/DsbC/DsbD-like thiol-disulfide interchange protein